MARDVVRETWENFKLGLTQRQLDELLDELEQYTGGVYSQIPCEYLLFLHGVTISMPYWCSAKRGAYKKSKDKAKKSHHKGKA